MSFILSLDSLLLIMFLSVSLLSLHTVTDDVNFHVIDPCHLSITVTIICCIDLVQTIVMLTMCLSFEVSMQLLFV